MLDMRGMQQPVETDRLVNPAWIAENLDNPSVRIVEVSDMKNPEAYFEGHISGARHLFYAELLNEDETLKPLGQIWPEDGMLKW
jgi:3-mercaptopyruvate sulfurtransferase SseA